MSVGLISALMVKKTQNRQGLTMVEFYKNLEKLMIGDCGKLKSCTFNNCHKKLS